MGELRNGLPMFELRMGPCPNGQCEHPLYHHCRHANGFEHCTGGCECETPNRSADLIGGPLDGKRVAFNTTMPSNATSVDIDVDGRPTHYVRVHDPEHGERWLYVKREPPEDMTIRWDTGPLNL